MTTKLTYNERYNEARIEYFNEDGTLYTDRTIAKNISKEDFEQYLRIEDYCGLYLKMNKGNAQDLRRSVTAILDDWMVRLDERYGFHAVREMVEKRNA